MSLRVTLLGSGVLLPDDTRRSASHLVEGDGFRLLLDCGSGALHGMDRWDLPWRELTHLALSHFHTDHFGDLAPLLWALTHGLPDGRDEPLTLLGPPGLRRLLHALAAAHGPFILDPGFPVEVVELERYGEWLDPRGRFRLRTHPARHTPEAVAVRVETGARAAKEEAMGYTGDTGPEPLLGAFFQGVALLISECAVADPSQVDIHLSPRGAARLAMTAEPDLLVLTHLYPELDPGSLPDLLRAEGYTGRVVTGRDGQVFQLRAGRAIIQDETAERES